MSLLRVLAPLGAALFILLSPLQADDALAEADRLRKEGTERLENTLVPGYDADVERTAGIEALEKARDLYEKAVTKDPSLQARAEEAIVDINSQLFWARRDMKVRTGDEEEEEEEERDPEAEAREAYGAAEKYERENPGETFRIMVRFFEVAKRHIGTADSVRAQEKSFELQNRIIEARRKSLETGPCEQSLDVAAFEDSFRSIPDGDIHCFFYFGELLEKHWMDAEAARCFEKVLRHPKSPFAPRARVRLAGAKIRQGQMQEARVILERGANAGEGPAQDLLARISSSEFTRIQAAIEAARQKAVGGGKDAVKTYRNVAEQIRKGRGSLPLLPMEKICSEISRLEARTEGRERGSASCQVCSKEGAAAEMASFMTCPACAGKGKVQKVRTVRERHGRRWVKRKEYYWDTCDECHGNTKIVCRSCAGLGARLGGMSKKEQKGIQGLKDEVWGKELLVKASLSEAVGKVEKYVVKKNLLFLSHMEPAYARSGDLRGSLEAPPLADRIVPGDADATWSTSHGEVKFNFLLSWAAEFARTLSWVAFLDHPGAKKALTKGGPDQAGEEVIGPEEAGAFAEDLASEFVRVRGRLIDHGEDPDNPYTMTVDVGSRFPHSVRFFVWKETSRAPLEGLAGAYRLPYLGGLITAYDFSAEQKVRLIDPGKLVTIVGRIIPGVPARVEIWRIQEEGT